jgi:pSer/pThr/pTyr-binding forkhead associated (FHA) protein
MPFLRLYSDEHFQKQLSMVADRLTIGRAVDNDIVLQHPGISKHHAVIERHGNSFVLLDNNSANGVFLNGQRVERQTLSFWDEIQIYPYKLVYMALAALPGEEKGWETPEPPRTGSLQKETTTVLRQEDIARLRSQMQQQKPDIVYLLREGVSDRQILDKPNFTLGRARASDLRCGGWFAPALSATIQQRPDGHYLVPAPRGRVMVNGLLIHDAVRLAENDRFSVQGVALSYFMRPCR